MNKVVSLLFVALGTLSAWAIPDNITLTVTNPWTQQPAVFNLQRYNLRATNYQVRIFSDATNYTLLPTNQIPEPTTYRGRITGDPGAFVVGAFKADGKFYYNVSYGSRWQSSAGNADPYDGTNRLSWGGWGATVSTAYIPSLGYATNSAPAANTPTHLNWTGGFNTNAPVSYGGPPYLNNLKQLPLQRVRMVLDSDYYRLFSNLAGNSITTAILMQESRINDVDFEEARDLGICYQIPIVCVRTNVQQPYTTTTGNLGELNAFWNKTTYGYSSGVGTNGLYDMVHGSVNVADAGGWAYAPGDFSVMAPDWCGFASGHEIGHNWGQGHYNSVRDYTGDNFWHITMTGSGFGHSTRDVQTALNLRRNSWKGGLEWVKYNADLPPHASPDLVTTKTNQAVGVNVLLNDYIGNSNTLSIASFETNTVAGGVVTNLGGGVLRYTPANNFVGYDLFRYYVTEPSGLKSLTATKVLVTSDGNPLLGQWPLNETSGNSAAETTGSGHAATLHGSASFTSGSVPGIGGGTALHLDGAGYVRFKGTWFDPLDANMTLSLWCRPDTTPSGEQMLFMKSAQNGGSAPGLRLGMNATSFFFSGATHGGAASFSAKAAIVPQAGVWYHLVGEIDRTSGLVRLWVNGVEYTGTSNTRTIPAGEFILGDNWPCLGMANDGGGNKSWFTGAIDDLRLYTKALTASEIGALYQGGGILPAGGPRPANGEINVALQPAMGWTPGATNTLQYRVYFGTSSNAVASATTNSSEYLGQVSSPAYTPAPLNPSTTYYWRVDEVSGPNLIAGEVWRFATAVDALHGGLRLYLSLDTRDTVGTTTFDRSGAPYHDGTLNNSPTPTHAPVYEGFAFNGSSSHISTPALNVTGNSATFLAWIRRDGAQPSYAGLVFTRGSSVLGLDFRGTSNELGYHWNDEAGTYNYDSNLTPPDGQWALAALTVTSNRAIFYLGLTNGTLQKATNNYTHVALGLDGVMNVGRDPAGGRNFNGAMDEVAIWNRALTAAEIGQILTNGINGMSIDGARPVADPGTFTWVGDTDAYWTNASNWATNATPVAGSTVYFNDAAAGNTGTQLGANFNVGGLHISGGLRGVGVAGTNTLTLGSAGILITNATTTLKLDSPIALGAAQTWIVPDGSALTLNGKLTGPGSPRLTITGGGNVDLKNNASGSSYGGVVVVGDGTLNLPFGWNTPSLSGNVSVAAGASLVFNDHPYGPSTINTTTNAGTIVVNGDNHLANLELFGGQVIGSGGLRVGDYWGSSSAGKWASRANNVTATINVAYLALYRTSATFTVENGPADPDLLISAPLRDGANGPAGFTKLGTGTLQLTQPGAYTGSTTVGAGTLQIDGGNDILPAGTSLTVSNGATLVLNGNRQTVTRLFGTGSIHVGLGAIACLTASTDTFGGVISGTWDGLPPDDTQTSPSGGFAMNGPGKLTFTNRHAYAGDTWISSGTLALTGVGSITNSANIVVSSGATFDVSGVTGGTYTLRANQTLEGNGTVKGTLLVSGTLAPGHSIGVLTFSNSVTLAGNTVMEIARSGASLSADKAVAVGTLTQGGTLTVTHTGDALAAGDTFDLFDGTFNGGFASFNLPALAPGLIWNTSQLLVNGTISVMALEAPTLAGGGLAGGGLQLSFSGPNGQTYQLLGATNVTLPLASWTVLTSGTFGAVPVTFTNTAMTNQQEFYRVKSP